MYIFYAFYRQIPAFWETVQTEMNLQNDEILVAKVIFTVLGYTTKSSIAAIRSKKGVMKLEDEFTKRKSTSTIFLKFYDKYPFLQDIVCFPSGLQLILTQIIMHLNRSMDDDEPTTVEKVLKLAQQV